MWYSLDNPGIKLNDEQLKEEILSRGNWVSIIDGPSGCGKTRLVNSLNSEGTVVMSCRRIVEGLVSYIRKDGMRNDFIRLIEEIPCETFCLEDADWSLQNKESMQETVGLCLLHMTENRRVIVTGINIENRCGRLLYYLKRWMYAYYRFCE